MKGGTTTVGTGFKVVLRLAPPPPLGLWEGLSDGVSLGLSLLLVVVVLCDALVDCELPTMDGVDEGICDG